MATNLVSLVMQFLTPDTVGRIASALGLDRNKVQTAVDAAVPALLAGFGNVAAQPGGPQKLVDAVSQQGSVLGNFANMLGTGGQSSFVEKGAQLLSSLLGGRDQTALAGAVGNFAGLGQNAGGSLLGMLAPVVMGTIARQGGRTLDANGITSLLASQKESIAAALPSGFGNLLGGTHLLDSLGGAAQTAAAAASQTGGAAASAAQNVGYAGQRGVGAAASPSLNWLWVIPVAAIAALLIYLLAKPAEEVAQKGASMARSLTVGSIDIGEQVTDSMGNLRNALGGITDVASAEAALPKLRQVTGQIGRVERVMGPQSSSPRN